MNTTSLEFFDATANEILDLPRDRTIFLFSMGPLEDHGRHLPLGTDVLEARALAVETASRIERDLPGWRCVVMPPLPGGIDSNTTRLALTVRPHVARDWLVDHCLGLARHGFRYFAVVSGNPGPKQLTAMEEASRLVAMRSGFLKHPKPRLISLSSGGIAAREVWLSPFWPDPIEHGAKHDISFVLASPGGPERVREDRLTEPARDRGVASGLQGLLRRLTHKVEGSWGPSPRESSADEGRKIIQTLVDAWWEPLKGVLVRGAHPNRDFRTWYSVLPPNKSFFKAWLLFLLSLGLMTFWVFFTLNAWVDNG